MSQCMRNRSISRVVRDCADELCEHLKDCVKATKIAAEEVFCFFNESKNFLVPGDQEHAGHGRHDNICIEVGSPAEATDWRMLLIPSPCDTHSLMTPG